VLVGLTGRLRIRHSRSLIDDLEPEGGVAEAGMQFAAALAVQEGGHQFAHHEIGVFDHVAAAPVAAPFRHEPAGHGHPWRRDRGRRGRSRSDARKVGKAGPPGSRRPGPGDKRLHLIAGGAGAWVRSTLAVVADAGGRPLYLFVQAEDVTRRRRALEDLRASEERFRLLVESVTDYAIFMLDQEGRVSSWNAGAERMKGYRAEEIIGQHFRVFYPPEQQAAHHPEHELELAVRDGRYEEEGWRVRQDGTRFWANVVITALFDHDRNLVGFGRSPATRPNAAWRRNSSGRPGTKPSMSWTSPPTSCAAPSRP